MKMRVIILGLISLLTAGSLAAQVETDDMYFNSKDRAKLREAKRTETLAMANERRNRSYNEEESEGNPTDSYSARNVNPEYVSRANSETSEVDEEDYYVNDYRFQNPQNFNYGNNNYYNNGYVNSWHRPNYWGPSVNTWNSRYYGYYDSWNNPWYDPYWGYNGYSSSFNFFWGNGWSYGWGGSYNYWNRPYCPGGFWNNYYAGNPYWNNFGRPAVIIIDNDGNGGRNYVNGKRPSRGSAVVENRGNRTRTTVVNNPGDGDNTGGRVTNRNNRSTNWDRSSNSNSSDSRSRSESNRAWYNNNSSNSSNSSFSPSRSSGSGSSGSSGGNSGGGSGSSGRTRGRN